MTHVQRLRRNVPVLRFATRAVLALVLAFTLAACASAPSKPFSTTKETRAAQASSPASPAPPGSPVSAVVAQEEVRVEPLKGPGPDATPPTDYVVGPNDVLYVNVYGRPEMGSPMGASIGTKIQGSRVDGNGNIHLPLVGPIKVAGLTIGQVQSQVNSALKRYVKEPWAVVEIAEYRSQPLYLLGQFKAPGTYYMDRPYNLLQALSLANGIDVATADLRSARVIRDKKILPVDIYDLLRAGEKDQNIWLKAGDTIYVPDNKEQNVFVFGRVDKPGIVPMVNGRLTLPQALAAAGLPNVGTNIGQVRIIRSLSPTRGQFIVVDLSKSMRGNAAATPLLFPLMAGDIVYVPQNWARNWNDSINEILPSLQLVGAVLNPFVQIKFLRD